MKKLLAPLYNLKQYITDVLTILSPKVIGQTRSNLFRIFVRQYRKYKYWIEPRGASSLAIDVIIPIVLKDLEVLPYVIAGIKNHVMHPVKAIYVVAPNDEAIKKCALQYGCMFTDESAVTPITKADINFIINGNNRSGWIYQQLLKLNFDMVGTCENYLVVDADTVFINDIRFEKNGKLYFDFSDEYHLPYYRAFEILTGLKHTSPVSFIAHYMLFSKSLLGELKSHIKIHTGLSAETAVIELKDEVKEFSYFSEYETYANYCIQKYPAKYRLRYWFNKSLTFEKLALFGQIKAEEQDRSKTISFHSYNNRQPDPN